MSIDLIMEHLFIVIAASLLSIIIGLPLGILSYFYPKSKHFILNIVDILQTIPTLALLGIIMVFAGAGKITVIIGITLYSLLPIVRNTYLGLEQIDEGIIEAAIGMGMSKRYRLFKVELPLALPIIFTGVRIAVVSAIGTAVFAAFVGGGGLGAILNRGIRIQDMGMILRGTAVLMLIAVILDLLMMWFENRMKKNHGSVKEMSIVLGVAVLAFVLMIPSAIAKNAAKNELVLYDGDYSETQLMHHMAKMLIEEYTDLKVKIDNQMSQVNNFKALIGDKHSCDMMLSYDGTLLTTFLHLDPKDVPKNESIYEYADKVGHERHRLRLIGKMGFDNTYAIAVPQALADKYQLDKISDLLLVADKLVFGAEHDFFTQEGSMKYIPFIEFYKLKFKDSTSVDVSLKYAAIENGSFDVTEVFATDGLNRKAKLKVLKDDRKFFPDYNGSFLVREEVFERFSKTAPNLQEVLSMLNGKIMNEDMVNMTYQVDVLGKEVDEVARAFLVEKGLIH